LARRSGEGRPVVTPPEHFLAVLGVVLFVGLLLPQLLRPLRLPFATSLILVGSVLGPYGFDYVALDDSLILFGFLGATFQMLLAGSETRELEIRAQGRNTGRLFLLNGVLPSLVGIAIARAFDYGWTASFFVGIVFLSSSILLAFSMVEAVGLERTNAGRLAKGVVVVEDLGASVLAFLLFQTLEPHHRFPLPILAGLVLTSVAVLRMFLPEIVVFFFRRFERSPEQHEARLRLVIAVVLLVIFGYSTLDVHPVIAAFLVGFALAEIPESAQLRDRLESLGYGLFIPVFLFVVGIQTDLSVLWRIDTSNALALAILFGATGSKLVGGFAGARWAGLHGRDATLVAISSMAKLAVPLSATYAARDLDILDADLFSAIVIVSVATSTLVPLALVPFQRAQSEA
jgi:Kef-type K+ transport system membrane component KefB